MAFISPATVLGYCLGRRPGLQGALHSWTNSRSLRGVDDCEEPDPPPGSPRDGADRSIVEAIKTLRSSSCKTSAEAKLMLAVRASPPAVVHRWLLQIFCVLMESDEALEEVYRLSGEAALSLLGLAQIVDDDRCATKLAAIDHLAPTCMELVRQLGEISTHLATLPFARRKEVLEWRLRKVKLSTGTWLGDDGTWRTLRGLDLPRCFLLSEWSSSTPFHVCLSLEESCSSIEENTGIALVGTSSEGVLYPRSLLSLAAPRRSRKSTMVNTAEHTTERRRMTTSVSKRPSGWTKEVSRSVPSGGVASLVAKAGSMSILQEQLALSMISWMRSCWLECPQGTLERSLGAAVRLYRVLCTSSGGVVEAVPNAVSLDSLKKAYGDTWVSLSAHFEDRWPGEEGEAALDKFCSSMAAYSVICYVLGVRDRHNANILLCDDGSICHVDFGFFLTNSPGNVAFEPSLKLTEELVETLGGEDSRRFGVFRRMVVRGCMVLRRDIDTLKSMIELLFPPLPETNGWWLGPRLPCLSQGLPHTLLQMDQRLRLELSEHAFKDYLLDLVDRSVANWRSRWYDRYQRYFGGIL